MWRIKSMFLSFGIFYMCLFLSACQPETGVATRPFEVIEEEMITSQDVTSFIPLGDFEGGDFASQANAISKDGTTVVGISANDYGHVAFRWTEEEGMLSLGYMQFPESDSHEAYSLAVDVSENGTIVIGLKKIAGLDTTFNAFIWTEENGSDSLDMFFALQLRPYSWANAITTYNDSIFITGSSEGSSIPSYAGIDAFVINSGSAGILKEIRWLISSGFYNAVREEGVYCFELPSAIVRNENSLIVIGTETCSLHTLPGCGLDIQQSVEIQPEFEGVTSIYAKAIGFKAIMPMNTLPNVEPDWIVDVIPDLPGGREVLEPNDMSEDGSVIVGYSETGPEIEIDEDADCIPSMQTPTKEAFRWSFETGTVSIGSGEAFAVTNDGNTIVGMTQGFLPGDGGRAPGYPDPSSAFIWKESLGQISLQQYLADTHGLASQLENWALLAATDISADGREIVGYGINPEGNIEAWLVRLRGMFPHK
ncbi:MAG: hypothetical protein JXA25_17590 [Anaerolineales bacterium]|nr:hypothetical protein [Anaerolineales bacterium]